MSKQDRSAKHAIEFLRATSPHHLDLLKADAATFDAAFEKCLTQAVRDIESNSKLFNELVEDGLTSVVMTHLNAIPFISIVREGYSNGHVDLTVTSVVHQLKKLGEAKIYNGYQYHVKGIDQLLNRYTTGREAPGFMLIYFKQPNIEGLMEKLRKEIQANKPVQLVNAPEIGIVLWSFSTKHRHKSGKDQQVMHYGCNLA